MARGPDFIAHIDFLVDRPAIDHQVQRPKMLIKKFQKIYIINKFITSFISFFIRAAVSVTRKYSKFFDSRSYGASIAWISLKIFWEFCEKVDTLIPSVKDLIRLESKNCQVSELYLDLFLSVEDQPSVVIAIL